MVQLVIITIENRETHKSTYIKQLKPALNLKNEYSPLLTSVSVKLVRQDYWTRKSNR